MSSTDPISISFQGYDCQFTPDITWGGDGRISLEKDTGLFLLTEYYVTPRPDEEFVVCIGKVRVFLSSIPSIVETSNRSLTSSVSRDDLNTTPRCSETL